MEFIFLSSMDVTADPYGRAVYKTLVCGRWLVGMSVSNPAGGVDESRECCVFLSTGLCDRLITRP